MPKITFTKGQKSIEVKPGENLMQALLDNGYPVASSCYGDGVCGKCRMQIIEGADNLSPANPLEKTLKDRLQLKKDERIACQIELQSDVTVDTTYW